MRIYIIGFMAAGKSFLGKALADKLDIPFHDLDELIEEKESRSIQLIFQIEGESYFRKLERDQLLNWKGSGVVSTGGGVVELAENRRILTKNNSITVWLNPTWNIIEKQIKDSLKRPLMKKFTISELQTLYRKRIPFYQECADIVLNDPDLDGLVSSINIYKKLHNI